MLDASGIVLQSAEHEIANIDKISPTITIAISRFERWDSLANWVRENLKGRKALDDL